MTAAGRLWGVTCYFNPFRYARRRANYRIFRQQLTVPLVTVELSYGQDFELHDDDAEVMIRRQGRDVLWQKERLLNVARQFLPPECRWVAWLDCDIIFARDDWAEAATELLGRVPLVQPFRLLHRLRPGVLPKDGVVAEQILPSTPFALAAGRSIHQCLTLEPDQSQYWSSLGVAWAARRELLDAHGLYDACIIGGGDRALVCAAWGCFDNIFRAQVMNERQREYYLAWALPFHNTVRGAVGCIAGDVFHLGHGTWENRQLRERHVGVARHGFDPYTDLAVDEGGSWQWSSDKPDLHAYVRNYFLARKEDD